MKKEYKEKTHLFSLEERPNLAQLVEHLTVVVKKAFDIKGSPVRFQQFGEFLQFVVVNCKIRFYP